MRLGRRGLQTTSDHVESRRALRFQTALDDSRDEPAKDAVEDVRPRIVQIDEEPVGAARPAANRGELQ